MRMIRAGVFALLSSLTLVTAGVSPAPALQMDLDTSTLQKLLREEPQRVFLLDVRTAGEYAQGHLPGSVLIPMNQVERRLREIPRDRKVVAICASGARSAAVARFLAERGYPWVANYLGGVSDWSRRGLALNP